MERRVGEWSHEEKTYGRVNKIEIAPCSSYLPWLTREGPFCILWRDPAVILGSVQVEYPSEKALPRRKRHGPSVCSGNGGCENKEQNSSRWDLHASP